MPFAIAHAGIHRVKGVLRASLRANKMEASWLLALG
jgi:hypothetical protein